MQKGSRKRLSSVSKLDVKGVGAYLKCVLMSQNISLKEIDQYLFPKENLKSQQMTIGELEEQLKKSPFNLTNQLEIVQLARYLVEDNNTNDFVEFNENSSQNIAIIRSVFKALVNQYTLFTEEEKQDLGESVRKILAAQNLQNAIMDQLTKVRTHKKMGGSDLLNPICTKEEFDEIDEQLELHQFFKSRELDFINYELYMTSQDLQKMSLQKFFDQYDTHEVSEQN